MIGHIFSPVIIYTPILVAFLVIYIARRIGRRRNISVFMRNSLFTARVLTLVLMLAYISMVILAFYILFDESRYRYLVGFEHTFPKDWGDLKRQHLKDYWRREWLGNSILLISIGFNIKGWFNLVKDLRKITS